MEKLEKISDIINEGNYKLKLIDQKERLIESKIGSDQFRELFFEHISMRYYFKDTQQEYIVDEFNKSVINYLFQYLTGCESFSGNLYKGIILIGKIGCGKTLLMEVFIDIIERCTIKRIFKTHSKDLEFHVKENGIDYFRQRPLFIDDIGKEQEQIKDFGTIRRPFEDLVSFRYGKENILFGTSNLKIEDLPYSLHTIDRMKETCNFIELPGPSRRK